MKRDVIGILTANVRLYYDLSKFLRTGNLKFKILDFNSAIPNDIGVILTSPEELDAVNFEPKIAVEDLEIGIRKARQAMNGLGEELVLVIGVDPGPEPGIAALSNGLVIETRQAQNPEHAADIIFGILNGYSFSQSILRIGNGSPEYRDRILELVSGNFNYVEIVDETGTSKVGEGHVDAAVRIASTGEGFVE
ncbi:MAG: hypothetical protein FP824_02105 [Euryarchaeota archaeon]|nr:hypothetical protein [Euryarchaeota archaeon]MBU4033000.1 hypothetical protein [Candidatus Thermoplasmatota archaeon]MBU4071836.1 hypothetical protein [Candidatus Thermoplasmatota archaeon]MBU4144277.1 hypothetical protein [Candidatus Thermoplasmatota archaeon]